MSDHWNSDCKNTDCTNLLRYKKIPSDTATQSAQFVQQSLRADSDVIFCCCWREYSCPSYSCGTFESGCRQLFFFTGPPCCSLRLWSSSVCFTNLPQHNLNLKQRLPLIILKKIKPHDNLNSLKLFAKFVFQLFKFQNASFEKLAVFYINSRNNKI